MSTANKAPDYPALFPPLPLSLVADLANDGFTFEMVDGKPFLILRVDPAAKFASYLPIVAKYAPYCEFLIEVGIDFLFLPNMLVVTKIEVPAVALSNSR